ncbi:MAG: hypothetical protein U9R32_06190 [Bacteroidota bacterium]|nr:hypothetical protein [Bacteroidota bacterium]
MNTKEIKLLLDKYFEGKTSLQEERALREILLDSSLPAELRQYSTMFDFFKQEKQNTISDDFEKKLLNAIKENRNKKRKLFSVMGMAASIIVIIGVSLTLLFQKPHYNENEILAYRQTTQALQYASHYINIGLQPINKMSSSLIETEMSFDKSVAELNKLNRVNCGYDKMQMFTEYFNYQPIKINGKIKN